MARGRAVYTGEEIEVTFGANSVPCDYGVDRSPIWTEWVDPEIEDLTILGHRVNPKILPDDLLADILDLANEVEFETT